MRKFIKLFESALSRYTTSGFMAGDLVKFKDNILKDEFFKTQPEDIKNKIQELVGSDLNLRVCNIKPKYPTAMGASNSDYNGVDYNVEIGQELMPGKTVNQVVVPSYLVVRIDTTPGLAPIPDSLKYDNKIKIKPEPIKAEENEQVEFYSPKQTMLSDNGKGKLVKGDRQLLNKNIKIPAKTAEGHPDPAVGTAKYLPKKK